MSMYSVPCWHFSDKDAVTLAFVSSSVHVSILLLSHHTISALHTSVAPPITILCCCQTIPPIPAIHNDDSVLKEVCPIDVKRPQLLHLEASVWFSKEGRTVSRKGAHFRENPSHLEGRFQSNAGLITMPSLTVVRRKLSQHIGALLGSARTLHVL